MSNKSLLQQELNGWSSAKMLKARERHSFCQRKLLKNLKVSKNLMILMNWSLKSNKKSKKNSRIWKSLAQETEDLHWERLQLKHLLSLMMFQWCLKALPKRLLLKIQQPLRLNNLKLLKKSISQRRLSLFKSLRSLRNRVRVKKRQVQFF